jgi:acetolactate synthase small subunit
MNIVLRGQDGVVEQARRQLEDLVPVWVVLDYSHSKIVERELLLAKVSILGPEHFHELLAHHREDFDDDNERPSGENPEVYELEILTHSRVLGFKMDRFIRGF